MEDERLANRLRTWGPAAAWAAVLFLLSAVPDLRVGTGIPFGDKLGHLTLYAVLGLALAWGRWRAQVPIPHILLLAIGALYGMTDEVHQMFVPGRQPDFADWVADVIGLAIGYGTALTLTGRTRNGQSRTEAKS
jgi:VanZ family protein